MRRSNVWVIFRREVRDQLRDRRTLFMILVLPILLYPMLGIGLAQLSTAFEQKPRTVVVVGVERLPAEPPLLNPARDRFDPSLFDRPEDAALLRIQVEPGDSRWNDLDYCQSMLHRGAADAVILVAPGFRKDLEGVRQSAFAVSYDGSNERGDLTSRRVRDVLQAWNGAIVRARLDRDHLPRAYTRPVRVVTVDVAWKTAEAGGSVWARLFPFLLVMMALTGAFYPAVDICAGEKERGTMETLLISPASRSEIVLGKFFTVVLASMVTAILNLLSMGLTGLQLARQVGGPARVGARAATPLLGAPSLTSAFWMVVLLIPLSAFFSAVSLALAVLARSMKEGQYYMTPLYMVALPMIFLTLTPGVELDLFTSLLPITGVSLLLRALMQGDYGVARRFFLPVLVPTLVYSWIALRWAIDQFQREDILFREAERFDVAAWARHLLRHKPATPGGVEALLCFALMLTSAWFLFPAMTTLWGLALGQVGFILLPPVLLAAVLTSRPDLTLRLGVPRGRHLAIAVGLALALNPLVNELRLWVEFLFPAPELVKKALEGIVTKIPNLGTGLLLLAAIPAVCEEVAFRGYILSGFQRGHSTRSAIVLSALLFGFMHVLISLFQQLFNATLLGLVLGLLAVRSRSLLPGIVFHFLNNGLALLHAELAGNPRWRPLATALYRDAGQGLYHGTWIALGAVAAAALLFALDRATADSKESAPRDPLAEA